MQSRRALQGCEGEEKILAGPAQGRAKLGDEFENWYDQAANLKPEIPKKPPVREADKYDLCGSCLPHNLKTTV
jgi:hypothetical protein